MCRGSLIFWGTQVDKMTKRENRCRLVEERKADRCKEKRILLVLDICRCALEAVPVIHSGRRRQT